MADETLILDDLIARHGGAEVLSPAQLAVMRSLAALLAAGPAADPVGHARTLTALEGMLPGKSEAAPTYDLSKLTDAELDLVEAGQRLLVEKATVGHGEAVGKPADAAQSESGEDVLRSHLRLLQPHVEALRGEVKWLREQLAGRPADAKPDDTETESLHARVRGLTGLLSIARPDLRGQDLERAIRDAAEGRIRVRPDRNAGLEPSAPDAVSADTVAAVAANVVALPRQPFRGGELW
jgi:hypothetical protein